MIKYPEEIKAMMWERMLRNERRKTKAIFGSAKEPAGSAEKKVVDVTLMVFPDQASHDPAGVGG